MEGFYFDPLHGNCLRRIRTVLPCETYRVDGVYGNDEPNEGEHWFAFIRVVSRTDSKWKLEVDFAGKPITVEEAAEGNLPPKEEMHPLGRQERVEEAVREREAARVRIQT
tara:strand:+ start:868 stop:1197 length:330 start_codon:yes stop_codon:yes gene_type:complete